MDSSLKALLAHKMSHSGTSSGFFLDFPNMKYIFLLFSVFSPWLLGIMIILVACLNQAYAKGAIYLGGAVLAAVLNFGLMKLIGQQPPANSGMGENIMCQFIGFGLNYRNFYIPYPTSVFIAFTFAYLVMPMIYNKQINYGLVVLLSLFLGLDGYTKTVNNCTNYVGVILGTLIGGLFGLAWYSLIYSADGQKYLFFNELQSNNVICSKPTKQKFKCGIYKDGKLLRQM